MSCCQPRVVFVLLSQALEFFNFTELIKCIIAQVVPLSSRTTSRRYQLCRWVTRHDIGGIWWRRCRVTWSGVMDSPAGGGQFGCGHMAEWHFAILVHLVAEMVRSLSAANYVRKDHTCGTRDLMHSLRILCFQVRYLALLSPAVLLWLAMHKCARQPRY